MEVESCSGPVLTVLWNLWAVKYDQEDVDESRGLAWGRGGQLQ